MAKLTKKKQTQLILIGVITGAVIVGLYLWLIAGQSRQNAAIATKAEGITKEIDKVNRVVAIATQSEESLNIASNRLAEIESGIPAGNIYNQINNTLKQFNLPSFHVDLPNIDKPIPGSMEMLPNFPYPQANIGVGGTAYYYDFGKFVAAFENHFPYMRIQNLTLSPAPVSPEEHEKLMFKMNIITLIRTNSP